MSKRFSYEEKVEAVRQSMEERKGDRVICSDLKDFGV